MSSRPFPTPLRACSHRDQPGAHGVLTLAAGPGCPAVGEVCGFTPGAVAAIADGSGRFDVFTVAVHQQRARRDHGVGAVSIRVSRRLARHRSRRAPLPPRRSGRRIARARPRNSGGRDAADCRPRRGDGHPAVAWRSTRSRCAPVISRTDRFSPAVPRAATTRTCSRCAESTCGSRSRCRPRSLPRSGRA